MASNKKYAYTYNKDDLDKVEVFANNGTSLGVYDVAYDGNHRLTSSLEPDGYKLENVYSTAPGPTNGLRIRYTETVPGQTAQSTGFYYDNLQRPYLITNPFGVQSRFLRRHQPNPRNNGSNAKLFTYAWANDRPASMTDQYNQAYLLLTNYHGDVVQILNSTGTVAASYSYDHWGNMVAPLLDIHKRGVRVKITMSFYSLKDLSDPDHGKRLLEILSTNGYVIDKADEFEPIRKNFDVTMLPERWKGVGPEGGHSTCHFLFKGQRKTRFSGMVSWNINLGQSTQAFNGVLLQLTIAKKSEINKIINMGDELFSWCDSVYGYIAEKAKDWSMTVPGGLYLGLPGLMWVNYFGPPYLTESDFYIPPDHVPIAQGARLCLSEKPTDDILSYSEFLQHYKTLIGAEWFWKGNRNKPRRIPRFDHSALIRS